MKIILSILGVIASLALLAGSAAMNWQFGFSLGKTPLDGMVYGGISVASDVLKCLVPFFIAWAFYNKKFVHCLAGLALLVITVGYSLTSSVGYSASNRGAISHTEEVQTNLLQSNKLSLVADTERLQDVRKQLQAYATALKSRGYLKRSERTHRAALIAEQDKLKADIAQYKKDLALGVITVNRSNTVTSQQGFIASAVGLDEQSVTFALIALLALLMEVGSTLGLWVSLNHFKAKSGVSNEVEQSTSDTLPAPAQPVELPKEIEVQPSKGLPKLEVTPTQDRLGVTMEGTESNIVLLPKIAPRAKARIKAQKYHSDKALIGEFLDSLNDHEIRPNEAWEQFRTEHPGQVKMQTFFRALKSVSENHGYARKTVNGKNFYKRAA